MKLTYYDFAKAVLPDDRIKGVFEPREYPGVDRSQFRDQVDQTLQNSHFVDRLVGHKRMLILVDDITRETPVDEILPSVLGLADQAGIKKEDTRILVALGTHRPLSQAEKIRKFGLEVVNQVDICSHDYKKDVVQLGRTSQGTPIELNCLVTQYDFMMGIGLIVPHRRPVWRRAVTDHRLRIYARLALMIMVSSRLNRVVFHGNHYSRFGHNGQ